MTHHLDVKHAHVVRMQTFGASKDSPQFIVKSDKSGELPCHEGLNFVSAIVHIVDDDGSFRTSTGRVLRASGYTVEIYQSGEQLLKGLPNDAGPACILLDIKMPGMSGPELQQRLKARG